MRIGSIIFSMVLLGYCSYGQQASSRSVAPTVKSLTLGLIDSDLSGLEVELSYINRLSSKLNWDVRLSGDFQGSASLRIGTHYTMFSYKSLSSAAGIDLAYERTGNGLFGSILLEFPINLDVRLVDRWGVSLRIIPVVLLKTGDHAEYITPSPKTDLWDKWSLGLKYYF